MLKDKILSEISARGPMPLDRYMELCNSHYYATRDPFGTKGDFTTAPEISQIFGEMIGIWAITQWQKLGSPARCALIEFGPGRGTLMKDLLRAIKVAPAFKPEIHLVETSPALRETQKQNLGENVQWHAKTPALDIPAIIVANEFFDALPIKQFVNGKERVVQQENRQLFFNLAAEEGMTLETCPYGIEVMKQISKFGAGIIIDYGYTQSHKSDSLQAVKAHKYHNVLKTPGEADITAHVDFATLAQASEKPCQITTQREFLLAHGADVRAKIISKESDLDRLINPHKMGELFKVLCF